MKPTRIYVKEVLKLLDSNLIKSCANITGGGLEDNLGRIIPNGLMADINLSKIKTKKIFKWIKSQNVSNKEMLKTFNCGVGFCLVTKPKNVSKIIKIFKKEFKPYIIGKIFAGKRKVKLNNEISW